MEAMPRGFTPFFPNWAPSSRRFPAGLLCGEALNSESLPSARGLDGAACFDLPKKHEPKDVQMSEGNSGGKNHVILK